MYSGTSGMLAYFVCRILFRVLGLGFIRRTLCEQQSLDAALFRVLGLGFIRRTLCEQQSLDA
ncbi:hypothetical protein T484DRAFT_1802724 [Baffinella frigidus]|nr:hypothetical protein T484DRAFT_1802724 [Cryptophyta sp. CCMP2293]